MSAVTGGCSGWATLRLSDALVLSSIGVAAVLIAEQVAALRR